MTKLEASKLGTEKMKIVKNHQKQERISEYLKSPSLCNVCNSVLPYSKRHNKFCSHSCSARRNNLGKRRHGHEKSKCLFCGKETKNNRNLYCSNKCCNDFQYQSYINSWINGDIDGKRGEEVSNHIRRWLKETRGEKCELCGIKEWTGKKVPLVLDHINGHPYDNSPNNLRLICRNCDGLLPTFSGKNFGNGRKARRDRIRKEKERERNL